MFYSVLIHKFTRIFLTSFVETLSRSFIIDTDIFLIEKKSVDEKCTKIQTNISDRYSNSLNLLNEDNQNVYNYLEVSKVNFYFVVLGESVKQIKK